MYPPRLVSLLLLPLALTQALKFELFSQPQAHVTPRCIRNFVAADTLVVVTAAVSGSKGDGQWVNIEVPPPLTSPLSVFEKWILTFRFGILRGMIMVVQRTWRVRREWRLLLMAIRLSMFVSRTSS